MLLVVRPQRRYLRVVDDAWITGCVEGYSRHNDLIRLCAKKVAQRWSLAVRLPSPFGRVSTVVVDSFIAIAHCSVVNRCQDQKDTMRLRSLSRLPIRLLK